MRSSIRATRGYFFFLYHYGIRGIVHVWFYSYLHLRTQTTNINPHISDIASINCGVPPGSLLGPLLFFIYIDDIIKCSDNFQFYLFADDTSILYSNKNLLSLEAEVKTEIIKLCGWLTDNNLTLNTTKSNYVMFLTRKMPLPYYLRIDLFDTNKGT